MEKNIKVPLRFWLTFIKLFEEGGHNDHDRY